MVEMFLTLTFAIAGVATMASEAIKRVINTDNKAVNAVVSWVVAIALTYGAWFIGYTPAISQPAWLWVLIEGVLVGLASTGIYDKAVITKIYDWIFSWINGEKWYDKIKD